MSSNNFNLSTLVAMREQRVEQTSVHFWRCRLTKESPRLVWNPDAERDAKKAPGESVADDDHDENAESATRHLLHVTGCVLAPEAAGIHLVTVRTPGYQPKKPAGTEEPAVEPEPCPILCVDPAVQRTLALGHEFVLDSTSEHQQEDQPTGTTCVFELAEGSGPVWLTGTHRVHRVVSGPAACCGDDDEDEEEEEEVDAAADVSEDIGEESDGDEEEEEDVEEDDEEDDDDQELIEEVKPAAKKKQQPRGPPQKQKRAAAAPLQQQRKRAKPDS